VEKERAEPCAWGGAWDACKAYSNAVCMLIYYISYNLCINVMLCRCYVAATSTAERGG